LPLRDRPHPRPTPLPYTTLFRSSKTATASATVRVMGPPTSLSRKSGTIPSRLVSPIVERMPTRLVWDAGPRMEFPVSVPSPTARSEEHTSELQSRFDLVCRLLLE